MRGPGPWQDASFSRNPLPSDRSARAVGGGGNFPAGLRPLQWREISDRERTAPGNRGRIDESMSEGVSGRAPSIERVMCAIDFSETADLALRHATEIARRTQARLVLGHVIEPLPVVSYPILMVPPDGELELRRLATDRLEARAAALREAGLVVETRLEQGPPGPMLVELSTEIGADLCVVGTRGLSGFEHLLFGSTAEYVVRHSASPVLTVHPGDEPLDRPMENVIVPTDLGPDSGEAIDLVVMLFAGREHPRVTLLFADRPVPYLEPFQHEILEEWHAPDTRKGEVESKLAPLADRLRAAGFEVESEIRDGPPVKVIVDLAEERGADLIVMNTRGRSTLAELFLGRTTKRIVQHAPCPVLTRRSAAPEKRSTHE
ncbi:MAG TPA: universal stress protein [Deltaproteobacteria bacterium]|nr:universal stress protein [Deltaproteobacteria bacterium]